MKMKLFFGAILYLILCSCSNDKKNEYKELIVLKIQDLWLNVNRYNIYNGKDTFIYYYPESIYFEIEILNNTLDTIIFGAFNRKEYICKYGYYEAIYNRKKYKIYSNSNIDKIWKEDSVVSIHLAYITDLPFLQQPLSNNEFKLALYDFIEKSLFVYNPIFKDYEEYLYENDCKYMFCSNQLIFNISMPVGVRFKLLDDSNIKLDIDDIGFKKETLPKDFKIYKAIHEF